MFNIDHIKYYFYLLANSNIEALLVSFVTLCHFKNVFYFDIFCLLSKAFKSLFYRTCLFMIFCSRHKKWTMWQFYEYFSLHTDPLRCFLFFFVTLPLSRRIDASNTGYKTAFTTKIAMLSVWGTFNHDKITPPKDHINGRNFFFLDKKFLTTSLIATYAWM